MICILLLLVTFIVVTLLVCCADAVVVTLPFIGLVIALPLLDFVVIRALVKHHKKKKE